jgi:hypothetical protein
VPDVDNVGHVTKKVRRTIAHGFDAISANSLHLFLIEKGLVRRISLVNVKDQLWKMRSR